MKSFVTNVFAQAIFATFVLTMTATVPAAHAANTTTAAQAAAAAATTRCCNNNGADCAVLHLQPCKSPH